MDEADMARGTDLIMGHETEKTLLGRRVFL
jgi:hypothetical protein